MAHREWKEAKQLPGTAGPGNMLGCCLISSYFLWAIHPIRPVVYCDRTQQKLLCNQPDGSPCILDRVRSKPFHSDIRSSQSFPGMLLLRLLMLTLAASAPRPSSALSYGPSFLQEPPPTVLYSNNSGLVLESVFLGQIIVFVVFPRATDLPEYVQGDYGGRQLHFVDLIIDVLCCCPTALQFLPNLQLPK